MSHPVAVIATAAVVALVVVAVTDFTRPKGARMFNRGKNGEDVLAFDPTSAAKK